MTITPALLALGADALRAEAGRRRRAAEMYAGEVRADKLAGTVKDVRTPAVKVLEELGVAAGLEELAQHIGERAKPEPVDPVPLVELLEQILERIDPGGEDVSVTVAAAEGAVAVLGLLGLEPRTPADSAVAAVLEAGGVPPDLLEPALDPDVAAARSVLVEDDGVDPIAASV